MSAVQDELLVAFYGDDFTGSTDALESLSLTGIRTVLFIDPPTRLQLSRYEGLQAIGVAGMSRSMSPAEMEDVLSHAFAKLRALNPRHVHYKVCSTFDSSPAIGSIGKAIDVGSKIFKSRFVPLLVAAPNLGRYCVFGNLFARMGIGSNGMIHRLDRHPSMMNHPTTPSDESDLRLHLQKQTEKRVALLDILQIERDINDTEEVLSKIVSDGAEVVLFDALYSNQIARIGAILDAQAENQVPLFSVGSSGIGTALAEAWRTKKLAKTVEAEPIYSSPSPILVVSGSCSPVTAAQIDKAVSHGFREICIDPVIFESDEIDSVYIDKCVDIARESITKGENVIVHTSRGADDQRQIRASSIISKKGLSKSEVASIYGTLLGQIAYSVAAITQIKRIVIAGGDTSSYAARAMGIESVEMIAKLTPGAPLCKANAPGSPIDGLELNFKGGQVGKENYFITAATGEY